MGILKIYRKYRTGVAKLDNKLIVTKKKIVKKVTSKVKSISKELKAIEKEAKRVREMGLSPTEKRKRLKVLMKRKKARKQRIQYLAMQGRKGLKVAWKTVKKRAEAEMRGSLKKKSKKRRK